MKLKKFAALALAGVMAVSMLAGCASNKPAEEPTEEPTAVDYTADLVAALNEDLKDVENLTIVADASLQQNLNAAVKLPGVTADTVADVMEKSDTSLKEGVLPKINTTAGKGDYKTDSAVQTIFNVKSQSDSGTTLAKTVISTLASRLQRSTVVDGTGNNKLNNLQSKSTEYTDKVNQEDVKFYFTYEYTLSVAVSTMTDPVNGNVNYVAAYTLTRTPTQVAVEA